MTHREDSLRLLPRRVKGYLGAMAIWGTPHSLRLQHYWSLTIWLFNVISRTLVNGVLPLCRDAFDVFYSPDRMGLIRVGRVVFLWGDAVDVFYGSIWLDHRILVCGGFPLSWDSVDVFYSPSWQGQIITVVLSLLFQVMKTI